MLVGRQREMARVGDLLAGLTRPAPGPGAVLEIVGDPGIGKSALLSWAAGEASRRGSVVLTGTATETAAGAPFKALVDAMDDFLAARHDDWPRILSTEDLIALGEVFPALREHGRAPVERYRVYQSLRALLERVAGRRGLVLALDDVHWAGPELAEALAHLVRRPPRARLLLLLAYRPRQVDPRLAAALATGPATVHRVALEPLTEAESRQLLAGAVPRGRVAALHQASGGNPFYLRALASTSASAGTSALAGTSSLASASALADTGTSAGTASTPPADLHSDLPAQVSAVLRSELAGLSPLARQATQAAAVLGDPIEADLVAEVAGLRPAQVTRALDEAHARDLVRPHGFARFAFRHSLVRDVIYHSAGFGWRREAHARAAQALRQRGRGPAACAAHVARSATVGDRSAATLLAEAADELQWQAPNSAAVLLREAIRILPADDRTNGAGHAAGYGAGHAAGHGTGSTAGHAVERVDLQTRLARCLAVAGQLRDARETVDPLLHQLPAGDIRRPSIVALAALTERLLGQHARARALIRHELQTVDEPAAASRLKLELGMSALLAGDFTADRALIEDAYRSAGAYRDLPLQAHGAALLALADYAGGAIARAQAGADSAASLVDALPDRSLAVSLEATAYLGWAEVHLERFHTALRHFDRGLRLARHTGQEHVIPYLLCGIACAYQWLGQLDTAARWADDGVAAAELSGSDELRTMNYAVQALVACRQGDVELAIRAGSRAVTAAGTVRDWWSATAGVIHGEARMYAGEDLSECVLDIVSAVGGPQFDAVDPANRPMWYQPLLYGELGRGHLDAAQGWFDRMHAAARPLGPSLRCRQAAVQLAGGNLSLARGDFAHAGIQARATVDTLAGTGNQLDLGRAYHLHGLALAASGRREHAVTELSRARKTFAGAGAHRLHDEASRALRRLGHRVSARRPAGPAATPLDQLTPREADIATLIADGLTNAQIAQRLVLSTRTVDAHLRNIFAKLDVTSRSALAAAVTARQVRT